MAKKEDATVVAGSPADKLKALQAAMDRIEKNFGKGAIMKLGDENIQQIEVIPTGSLGLDVALGVGGYPRGRIIEIFGPESSGKTTLAIHAIAEAQKKTSLVFPFLLFSSISFHCSLIKTFLSLLAILWNSAFS